MSYLPYFVLLFLSTIIYTPLQAQTDFFGNKKKEKTFSKQLTMPKASPSYFLSFTEQELSENFVYTAADTLPPVDTLLSLLFAAPQDYQLMRKIADSYSSKKDFTNAYVYYEMTYNVLKDKIDADPTNFQFTKDLSDLHLEINQIDGAIDEWDNYTKVVPNSAYAWASWSILETQQGDLAKSNELLQKAYELDATLPIVHTAIMSFELTSLIISIQTLMANDAVEAQEWIPTLKVRTRLFDEAIANHQSVVAQNAKDATLLTKVLLQTLILQKDAPLGKKKVTFELSSINKALLLDMAARTENNLTNDSHNELFDYKKLTVIKLLRNDPNHAAQLWESVPVVQQNDATIYGLLSLGYFAQMAYQKAAFYKQQVVKIAPSFEDYLALGRFYVYDHQVALANQAFQRAIVFNPNDYRAVAAKVSLQFQQKNWQKGLDLLETVLPVHANNRKNESIYYYQTLGLLLQKETATARLRLQQLATAGDYMQEAKELLKHFK